MSWIGFLGVVVGFLGLVVGFFGISGWVFWESWISGWVTFPRRLDSWIRLLDSVWESCKAIMGGIF